MSSNNIILKTSAYMKWSGTAKAAWIFIIGISLVAFTGAPNTKTFVSHYENVMGTSFELKLSTGSENKAELAEKIGLAEIARLSSILSSYDVHSEFSRWLASYNTPFKASPELIEVLSLFDQFKTQTNGALNPAFDAFNQVWKKAAQDQKIPEQAAIDQAKILTNQIHWNIDRTNNTITHLSKTPLAINSFVKSYIMEKAVEKIQLETGIKNITLNIGGDILTKGDQLETIEIVDPKASAINDLPLSIINLKNNFVATSGNYRRGYLINNQWYSHIIDPRTGYPASDIISATVVYNKATVAGALATAFNILSFNEIKDLAAIYPGIAYLLVNKEGKQYKNSEWLALEKEQTSSISINENIVKDDVWDPAYEMTVNLELAQIQGPYRRPFVAIWVEDSDKKSIRTLTVWFNKPRWLRDLRAWFRANSAKFNVESGTIQSVSSATRSAGKYEIKWDGKDDQGQLVKKGTYTVYIEVAREHGTYQLLSQEIKVNNKASKFELSPNTEVAAASIEVKKK